MNLIKKELYVAAYGQTAKFRAVKYAILIPLFAAIYWWKSGEVLAWTLGIALILALAVHFLFRFKTKGWTEPWGPYTPLKELSNL